MALRWYSRYILNGVQHLTTQERLEAQGFTVIGVGQFQRRPWEDTVQTVTLDDDRAEVVEVVEVADGEFETDCIVRSADEVLRAIENPSREYNLLVLRVCHGLGR